MFKLFSSLNIKQSSIRLSNNIHINNNSNNIRRKMTTTTNLKPKILRFGPIRYAQDTWKELSEIAEIVESSAQNREEFIQELKNGKFNDVSIISRTFESVNITGRIDEELVSLFPKSIKSICHSGAGYDQVDTAPLIERKIQLSNAPSVVDAATADTAVYLLLSCLRNFQLSHHNLLQGRWKKEKCAGTPVGNDPSSQVLGILGMGGIGRTIRDRLLPFGFKKIIYYNRSRLPEELEKGAEYVTLDELLSQSDVISISVPLNANTKHSINEKTISKMKDGIIIINTARGPVIDEIELIKNLKNGKIKSCGLDVFENEPNPREELYNLPNCVSLPHMGTHSVETMKAIEDCNVKNCTAFIKNGLVEDLVSELQKSDLY
ncbi:hypothetical protein B5S28_g444 [[Candida] boidinii]|nr:hypothetical protein B5S28_g444 [[Candida] boidinii]